MNVMVIPIVSSGFEMGRKGLGKETGGIKNQRH